MTIVTRGIYDMAQQDLPRKQKADSQTQRTDLWVLRGKGAQEGKSRRLGLADAND